MDAYEVNFHALSRYFTQLVTTKDERIRFSSRGFNFELQVLYVHRTIERNKFNEVMDDVKKVEGVRHDTQEKVFAKRAKNAGNFQDSYPEGKCFQPR